MPPMDYVIDGGVDERFVADYRSCMLGKFDSPMLPAFRVWEFQKVFKMADFQATDVVLDTGAMHTHLCVYIAARVRQIVATDNFYWAKRSYVKEEGLPSPEEWIAEVEAAGDGKLRAESADLMDLQYADAAFDKVICVSTIEHVLDDAKAMREMARVLKPGGRLVMTTEFNAHIAKPYREADNSYYRIYTRRALDRLIRASGLTLAGPLVVQRRNFLWLRTHVNALFCLTKPAGA